MADIPNLNNVYRDQPQRAQPQPPPRAAATPRPGPQPVSIWARLRGRPLGAISIWARLRRRPLGAVSIWARLRRLVPAPHRRPRLGRWWGWVAVIAVGLWLAMAGGWPPALPMLPVVVEVVVEDAARVVRDGVDRVVDRVVDVVVDVVVDEVAPPPPRVVNPPPSPPPSSLPPSPALPVCAGAPPARLAVGQLALVAVSRQNIRQEAVVPEDFYANIVAVVAQGDQLFIIGGPVCAHGGYWWQVIAPAPPGNPVRGWMREATADRILLVPK